MATEIELDRTPTTIRGATRYEMIRPEPQSNAQIIPFREMAGEIIHLPTNSETDAAALMNIGAVSEKSTPEQRATATTKKLIVFCGASTLIAISTMLVTENVLVIGTVEIVGLLIACVITIWLDRNDSPLATERSKSRDYKSIRMTEISAQERMFNRRMETLEKIMGGVFNADNRKK